jgi:hypothetical protein
MDIGPNFVKPQSFLAGQKKFIALAELHKTSIPPVTAGRSVTTAATLRGVTEITNPDVECSCPAILIIASMVQK